MAILPVRIIGSKVLRTPARKVERPFRRYEKLVKNMFETMYNEPGIGLAAPQIGVPLRIAVIDIKDNPIVLFNPRLKGFSEKKVVMEEGCLSIPGVHANVERPEKVILKAFDIDGFGFELEADELLARCIQHELDHLDGILFIDRISDGEREKLKKELDRLVRTGEQQDRELENGEDDGESTGGESLSSLIDR